MKTCNHCTKLVDGICAAYGRQPPSPEFAEKCRHYDLDPLAVTAPETVCANCHRYDQDETGEWCLYREEADCVTFRPVATVERCPLQN